MADLLIADDDAGVRSYLEMLFRLEGHRVVVAADGHQARAQLADRRFDAVVLDVVMPGPTGLQLLDEIPGATAVVLHTGEDVDGPEAVRADAVVVKPSDLDTLVEVVAGLVADTLAAA